MNVSRLKRLVRTMESFWFQSLLFIVLLLILSNIYPFYAQKPRSSIHLVSDMNVARVYVVAKVFITFVTMFYLFVLPYMLVRDTVLCRGIELRLRRWYVAPFIIAFIMSLSVLVVSIPMFFEREEAYRVALSLYPAAVVLNVITYVIQWFIVPALLPLVLLRSVAGSRWRDLAKHRKDETVIAMVLCFFTVSILRPLIDGLICLGIVFASHCYPCIYIYLRGYHPDVFKYLTMVLEGKLRAMYMAFPTWGTLVAYIVVGYINGKILYRYLRKLGIVSFRPSVGAYASI